MNKLGNQKHQQELPNARKIKRSCNRELYRTIKKMKIWIQPEQVTAAEDIYFKKVILNFAWIAEHGSNRKKLSDWWEENVCPDIANLWNVEAKELSRAFRESFGG